MTRCSVYKCAEITENICDNDCIIHVFTPPPLLQDYQADHDVGDCVPGQQRRYKLIIL